MIRAHEHIRQMRGGSQAQLFSDGNGGQWVVKFLNNPQHPRVLVNEWIASSLARVIGLTVPDFDIMDVAADVIERNSALAFRYGGRLEKPVAGPAFASKVPTSGLDAPTYDYLPEAGLELVHNLTEFPGVLAVDKWLCQCDGRQVVFCRPRARARLRAYFIDWGFVFNAGDWSFPDSPLRGVYSRNMVYQTVTDWQSFEPWLSRIERFPEARLQAIIAAIPSQWATGDELDRLQAAILDRRSKVRDLIETVRLSPRAPFENWASRGVAAQGLQPQAA